MHSLMTKRLSVLGLTVMTLSACGFEDLQVKKEEGVLQSSQESDASSEYKETKSAPFLADKNIPDTGKPVLVSYIVDSEDMHPAIAAELLSAQSKCNKENSSANFAFLIQSQYKANKSFHLCKNGEYKTTSIELSTPESSKSNAPFTDAKLLKEALVKLQSSKDFFESSKDEAYRVFFVAKGHGSSSYLLTDLDKDICEEKICNMFYGRYDLSNDEISKMISLSKKVIGNTSDNSIDETQKKELIEILKKVDMWDAKTHRKITPEERQRLDALRYKSAKSPNSNNVLSNKDQNLNQAYEDRSLNQAQGGEALSNNAEGLNASEVEKSLGGKAISGMTAEDFYAALGDSIKEIESKYSITTHKFGFIVVESCFSSMFAKRLNNKWDIFKKAGNFFNTLTLSYGYYASQGLMGYRNLNYDLILSESKPRAQYDEFYRATKEARVKIEKK